MFKLPMDENTCIIQGYFDGGESYPEHQKYSLVKMYKTSPQNVMNQEWDSVRVSVEAKGKSVIERNNLDVDISDYDRFRIFAMTPDCVHVKLFCNDELVIDKQFGGKIENLDGDIKTTQKVIKSIRYEFENSNENPVSVTLYYLGMVKDVPEKKNQFNNDWEGFFAEEPNFGLYDNNLITEEELDRLRELIKKEPFDGIYEKIKKTALKKLDMEPEKFIKRTVSNYFREPINISGLEALALVGQIEKNTDMLKLACRGALSICSCEYWCCDPMETAPAITWNHRSFTVCELAKTICTVISLAGSMLSWHGMNFLYNSLIMKALPRMEADFMTMEYIYTCNQGIVFMSGYIQALVTLADRFPRYKKRISEAVVLLDEMLENSFSEDGSTFEGASYWHYTMVTYLYGVYFLAKGEKKTLREYVGNKLDKMSDFGLSLLNERGKLLTMNDCGYNGSYSMLVPVILYSITSDERWMKVICLNGVTHWTVELAMIASVEMFETDVDLLPEFKYLPTVGYTQVYREGIHFVGTSGPSNSTHSHSDKGGFIIYKNGEIVVPDPCGAYNKATPIIYNKTDCHSLCVPVINGVKVEQLNGDGYESLTKKASYENGEFEWQCDNGKIWGSDAIKKSIRTVYSNKPNEFIITDEFEFSYPARLLFRVNAMNRDALKVEPVNWVPAEEKVTELCEYAGGMIYQICKLSEESTKFKIKTKVCVL